MTRGWITTSSTHVEAIVNPVNAACDRGFVPDRLYVIENPGVTEQVDRALDVISRIVTEYGGDEPAIELTSLERDVEFGRIHDHIREAIAEVDEEGGEVAVDITPGRKFMSAIAFTAGIQYDADHVYYLYITSAGYFGQSYPEMPRTAMRLYDFTEEL